MLRTLPDRLRALSNEDLHKVFSLVMLELRSRKSKPRGTAARLARMRIDETLLFEGKLTYLSTEQSYARKKLNNPTAAWKQSMTAKGLQVRRVA